MTRWIVTLYLLTAPCLAAENIERIVPAKDVPTLEMLFPGRLERIAPPESTAESQRVVVAVAIPFLAEMTEALCRGTGIIVEPVLDGVHIPMDSMARVLAEREAELKRVANGATACVTLRGAWSEDPLYPLLRRHNIRMIEIDATRPLDGSSAGIALLSHSPMQDTPPPYVWLHPGNALRMAEIVAADLARLAPTQVSQLRKNLSTWREPIVAMQNEYQVRLSGVDVLEVMTLSNALDYLLTGFAVPIVAQIDTSTEAIVEALAGVPVAVSDHEPEAGTASALQDIRVAPVVLDPLWHWPSFDGRASKSYLEGMRSNLDRLVRILFGEE